MENKSIKKGTLKIRIAQLKFPEIKLKASELHKARGYFGNEFKQFDLLHNHDDNNKSIYRYPAIQFKIADHDFSLFSFGQKAIDIMKNIFLNLKKIVINKRDIPVYQSNFNVMDSEYGISDEQYLYQFTSPWIALNSKNYKEYMELEDEKDKNNKLNSILINNIISFSKFAGYTILGRINIKSRFHPVTVNLKAIGHTAFKGEFLVNFMLPDFLGLGKSSSRGYGCIKRKM